jgi:toxin ParE1/3/4
VPALEWRKLARSDLLEILDYISDDSPDAAQGLIDEIEVKAAKLVLHPRLYKTGRVHGTREMVVRTNYVVVYMENEQTVSILRVLHAARQWPPDREDV